MTQGEPVSAADAIELSSQIQGSVIIPADDGWHEARSAWNLSVDQHPELVVFPECSADIVETVRFARARGMAIAAQATGHGAGSHGPLESTILLKTSRMRGVTIDPETRRARVEAGAQWIDVTEAAAEYGLAALAGSSPDVGVVGFTLGGGLSFLGRQFGSAAAGVQSIEIVTCQGVLKNITIDSDPDLFWALRGGGGNFGVVTSMEFDLHPVPEVYAGIMLWPIQHANTVLQTWSTWIESVPNAMTSLGRILHLPPIPDIPEFLRGRSFAAIEVAFVGDELNGRQLVQPLRDLGPEIDTIAMIPAHKLSGLHMDPDHPVPAMGNGLLLNQFKEDAIVSLLGIAGDGSRTPLLSIEVRHLGGAFAQPPARPCACTFEDAGFAVFAVGMTMSPEMTAAVEHHLRLVQTTLGPWGTGRHTPNFAEGKTDPQTLYPAGVYARLQTARATHDPDGLFRSNHVIGPSAL